MKSTYKFLSTEEPSEEELHQLMQEVLKEVKKRSEIAEKKFQTLQIKQINEAKERFKNRSFVNDSK